VARADALQDPRQYARGGRGVAPITRVKRPVDRAESQLAGDVQDALIAGPERRPEPGLAGPPELRLDDAIGVVELPEDLVIGACRQVRMIVGVVGKLMPICRHLAPQNRVAPDPLPRT